MQKSTMAQIHPSFPIHAPLNSGEYRERDVLIQLADGFPAGFDIFHPSQTFVIEATAGSGKTQLALALLKKAASAGQRGGYICFNRPLADHLARLAPTSAEATNFHQLCRDVYESQGHIADFSQATMLSTIVDHFLKVSNQLTPKWDLLIIDESQDLEHAWASSLLHLLKYDGL